MAGRTRIVSYAPAQSGYDCRMATSERSTGRFGIEHGEAPDRLQTKHDGSDWGSYIWENDGET